MTAQNEAVLLAAIAADPDDDDARAVLADWFAERGDPRGELIQLEIARARLTDDDDRKKPTTARITELVKEHGDAWLAPFARISKDLRFSLDRGLVGHVEGPATALVQHTPKLLTHAALVRSVNVWLGRNEGLEALAGSALLARARRLAITGGKQRLTGCEGLGPLVDVRALTLANVALGPDDVEALFAPPRLAALRTLVISLCRLNRGAIEPLARLACALRELDMAAYHLGPRLGQIVGDNPSFHALETLVIPGNDLGSEGLAALLPALQHVERLDLRGCKLALADLQILLDTSVVPNLRILELGGNPLGDAGAELVAQFAGAPRLTKLHLGEAGVTARGARSLAAAASLANLRSLVLSGPRFDAATDAALVASPHLANARIYAGNRQLARPKPISTKKR